MKIPRLWFLLMAVVLGAIGTATLILVGIIMRPPALTIIPPGMEVRGSTLGDSHAPVIVEEYSDFQCSICANFATEIRPHLLQEYVATGKVFWVFRHLPRLGVESIFAAIAAECAAELDQFWTYSELLFAAQAGVDSGAFKTERLKEIAHKAGLDVHAFTACVEGEKPPPKVLQDSERGRAQGFEHTPTFVITGRVAKDGQLMEVFRQVLEGKQPVEVFRKVLDEALKATKVNVRNTR